MRVSVNAHAMNTSPRIIIGFMFEAYRFVIIATNYRIKLLLRGTHSHIFYRAGSDHTFFLQCPPNNQYYRTHSRLRKSTNASRSRSQKRYSNAYIILCDQIDFLPNKLKLRRNVWVEVLQGNVLATCMAIKAVSFGMKKSVNLGNECEKSTLSLAHS
jgi:hypothetical protein